MKNQKLQIRLTLILTIINVLLYAQNQRKLDSLFTLLKNTKADTTRVNAYAMICWEYQSSNHDTAIYFGNAGLKLAIKINYKKGMSSCYNNIGRVHKEHNNYHMAIDFFFKSLKICEELGDKKRISTCYSNIGIVHYDQGNYDKAIEYYFKSLKICEELGDKKGMSDCYNHIGSVYDDQGNYIDAIEYFLKSLKICEELGNKKGMFFCYNNIGIVHSQHGNYPNAIEYFLKSLKISEELGNKEGMSACYNNIGSVQDDQGNYTKAIEYYLKSLKIHKELGNKKGMSNCYNNISGVNYYQSNYTIAIEYLLKSLKIDEELGDKNGMSTCYNNIGLIYMHQGNYPNALEYFLKSLKIREELGDKEGIAQVWGNIGALHITLADSSNFTQNEKNKHYKEAVSYGLKALNLAKEINALPWENEAAKTLKKAYIKLGNYKKSVEYAEIFIATKDSMFKEEKTKALASMEAKYQNEKKQLEIDKLGKEKELQLSENKKQKIVILFVVSGLLLVVVIAVVILRSLRIARRQKNIIEKQKRLVDEKNVILNTQNEEIRSQRDEIEMQRDEITTQRDEITAQRDLVTEQKHHIEHIHEELTDSIRYAERIQKAVLPQDKYIKDRIQGEFFILFKPKDIVSGDFYFIEQRKNWLLIAVADCTGHGVPGAFMSMLGISFLNEIIAKEEIQSASHVLDELRQYVIHSLQQKGIFGEQKDGMDIAFIALNTLTNELQFAGANNPLYLIRNNNKSELIEIKGDKMPVSIHLHMDNFTNQIIQIQKDDIIYLMSDGYEDQFGGLKCKKFLSKNLKQLIIENSDKSLNEQKEIFDNTIENWKNNNGIKYEQTDDITVLGIKI